MRTKRKGLLAFLLSLCMMLAMAVPVLADEETDKINTARNGVLAVRSNTGLVRVLPVRGLGRRIMWELRLSARTDGGEEG